MDRREKQEQRFEQAVQEKKEESRARAEDRKLDDDSTSQNEPDPRHKGSRHGQVTAENWNQ